MNIIESYKRRRRAAGVTQGEFAALCGLSLSLIKQMECGSRPNPTYNTIQRLESALSRLEAERKKKPR